MKYAKPEVLKIEVDDRKTEFPHVIALCPHGEIEDDRGDVKKIGGLICGTCKHYRYRSTFTIYCSYKRDHKMKEIK